MNNLSDEDTKFLAQCEEELKDRYTEKDEEFMKVFNAKPEDPPIFENWRARERFDRPHNSYRGYHNRDHHYRGNKRRYHDTNNDGRQAYYAKRPRTH